MIPDLGLGRRSALSPSVAKSLLSNVGYRVPRSDTMVAQRLFPYVLSRSIKRHLAFLLFPFSFLSQRMDPSHGKLLSLSKAVAVLPTSDSLIPPERH